MRAALFLYIKIKCEKNHKSKPISLIIVLIEIWAFIAKEMTSFFIEHFFS